MVEDLAGVDARELPGLRDGVEDLAEGVAVDGKVVDGFVGGGRRGGRVRRLREHTEDGASIGPSESSTLIEGHCVNSGLLEEGGRCD